MQIFHKAQAIRLKGEKKWRLKTSQWIENCITQIYEMPGLGKNVSLNLFIEPCSEVVKIRLKF